MSGEVGSCDSNADESVSYPTNNVVGILDTVEQVTALVPDLKAGGFADSDIRVHCGKERAAALESSTGRRGLVNLAIRIAELVGLENIEMERKAFYERAMREGRFVVLVAAPTEEHKDRASEALAKHQAHAVSFFGRFTIESIVPPSDASRASEV